ncbi:MAG: hypothetical protein MJZ05_08645 [Fibrobacter sp.]|nr:hypothetical protein [Fibrobacter sp.]
MKCKFLLGLALTALWACDNGNDVTKPSDDSLSENSSSSVQDTGALSSSSLVEQSSATVDESSSSLSSSQNEVRSSSSAVQTKSSSSAKVYTNYDPVTGILTDERDGEKYKTAKIGNQIWMGENLRYIDNENSVDCYLWDKKITDSVATQYGRHYSWMVATQLSCDWDYVLTSTSDTPVIVEPLQGICPDGWHVPSLNEWTTLFSSAPIGSLLSTQWKEILHGYDGTDDYGFSLQLGRYEVEDFQEFIMIEEYSKSENYTIAVYHDEKPVHLRREPKTQHFAYLRCIKD